VVEKQEPLIDGQRFNLLRGNCLDVLKTIPDNYFHAVVCDPPYGLSDDVDIRKVIRQWFMGNAYKHDKAGFMGACYHPDTEVLGPSGWRRVGDLRVGEEVYTQADGRRLTVPVERVYAYDFDGDLLRVGGRSTAQLITPNHKLWVHTKSKGWHFAEAAHLTASFRVDNQALPSPASDSPPATIRIGNDDFPADSFMHFLGLWLGDGYTVNRTNNEKSRKDFFGVSVTKDRKVHALRAAFGGLGIDFTERPDAQGRTHFHSYHEGLLKWLKPIGKAADKFVPNDLLQTHSVLLEALYRGLIETDGTVQGKGQEVFFTSSKKLRDDFQHLCFLTGRSCCFSEKPPRSHFWWDGETTREFKANGPSYVLSVLQRGRGVCWLERDGRTDRPQPAAVQPVPYKGEVSCVGLTEHHLLLTRFDGKTVWSGNSWDSFVPGPEIWKEVYRVMKPGAHLLAFTGSRTMDLMGFSIRFAGFEMRDTIMAWLYGTGKPKTLDVSKAIDGYFGAERVVVERRTRRSGGYHIRTGEDEEVEDLITEPATPEAKYWDGYHTGLKPGFEPVLVARKPLTEGTIVENILVHGTGGLNIGANKLPPDPETGARKWPMNVVLTHDPRCIEDGECHPECATKELDHQVVGSAKFFPQFYYNGKAGKDDRYVYVECGCPEPRVMPLVVANALIEKGPKDPNKDADLLAWEKFRAMRNAVKSDGTCVSCGKPFQYERHPCLVPGTSVLTEHGWAAIDSVVEGANVLGADGKLHPVVEVSSHPCDGPVFRVQLQDSEDYVDATGNHPFLVLREGSVFWIEAAQLVVGDLLLTPFIRPGTVKPWDDTAATRAESEPPPRRGITESPTRADAEWPTTLSGRPLTDPSLTDSASITGTKTSRTISFSTSNWSTPLHTSGCTLVASSVTECGGSPAACADKPKLSPQRTGTSQLRDGSVTVDVAPATSESSSLANRFVAHKVSSVERIPYSGPVWNLTVLDNPTFQTRVGMTHNTVKPTNVMRWLVRLVTPKGGIVLDCFNGSGSTGVAALHERVRYVGIEMGDKYFAIASARLTDTAEDTPPYEPPEPLRGIDEPAVPETAEVVPLPDSEALRKAFDLTEEIKVERKPGGLASKDFKRLVAKSLKR
jgi:DNA modification methylase